MYFNFTHTFQKMCVNFNCFLVVSGIIKSAHNYVFAVREFYLRKRVNE